MDTVVSDLECFEHLFCRIQSELNVVICMGGRHKTGLIGGWSQIDSSFEHAVKELTKAFGIALHNLLVIDYLLFFREEDSPHGAHMIAGEGDAGAGGTFSEAFYQVTCASD